MSTHGTRSATSASHQSASNSDRNQKPKRMKQTSFDAFASSPKPSEVEADPREPRGRGGDQQPPLAGPSQGQRQPDDAERTREGRRGSRRRSRRPERARAASPRTAPKTTSPATRAPSATARRRLEIQYGGCPDHQGPSALKAFQKPVFADWSSSDSSTSGVTSASIVGVNRWSTPSAAGSSGSDEREAKLVHELDRALAHDDHELRLDDVDLACQPRGCVSRILRPELEAVRPVDGERVDVQALERLQHRLSRAAEERHALLDLRRQRQVLQQEDVCERVARADDRDAELVAGPRELVAELVDLGNGLLQVALVDLVGGQGRWHGVRSTFSVTGPFP